MQTNDLIQQTRAADAAREAVVLNYGQSLMMLAGTILGFFTLAAAAFAAWYAREAANQSRRGADAAEKTLRAERAWMTFTGVMIERQYSGIYDGRRIDDRFRIVVNFTNQGRSPALDCKVFNQVFFLL